MLCDWVLGRYLNFGVDRRDLFTSTYQNLAPVYRHLHPPLVVTCDASNCSLLLLGFSTLDLSGREESRRSLLRRNLFELVVFRNSVRAENRVVYFTQQSLVLAESLTELQV